MTLPACEECSWVNGSKSFGMNSLLIPIPLSRTIIRRLQSSKGGTRLSMTSETSPPASVNFIAFDNRFNTISWNFRRSTRTNPCGARAKSVKKQICFSSAIACTAITILSNNSDAGRISASKTTLPLSIRESSSVSLIRLNSKVPDNLILWR